MKTDDGIDACICDSPSYFPVCGEDRMTYFSPCSAGCTNQSLSLYGGCSKVSSGQTTAGLCETDCPYLYYFLAVDVAVKLLGTAIIMPLFMTLMRSVEPKDKTIALGMLQFLTSFLGFLPSSILFGYIFDSSCLIWSYSCGVKGVCAQYNLQDLRFRMKSTECGGRVLGLILIILAYIVLRRQGGLKPAEDEVDLTEKITKENETTKM